ncbi:unannotated protein [freshwater metagenome]|uniref:Unannotated protein n=1 Tax=freshwater metagenome TaxID=449393 RepID=A0A6J6C6H6_9ZZZZ
MPVRLTLVFAGYFDSWAKISAIGLLKSILTSSLSKSSSVVAGKKWAGSVSNFSINTPSLVIFAFTCRSAEHETAIAIGREAPWRGNLTTRTS